jgi:hypothetical protein
MLETGAKSVNHEWTRMDPDQRMKETRIARIIAKKARRPIGVKSWKGNIQQPTANIQRSTFNPAAARS